MIKLRKYIKAKYIAATVALVMTAVMIALASIMAGTDMVSDA